MVLAGSCDDAPPDGPYFEFSGGGFVFNYRLASADYGFVVRVLRQPPDGSIIEAAFEDPAGGPPLTVRQTAQPGRLSYVFRSPDVTGVRAGRDYRVELRLLRVADYAVLSSQSRTFRSDQDQAILPEKPLAPGPGYQRPSE